LQPWASEAPRERGVDRASPRRGHTMSGDGTPVAFLSEVSSSTSQHLADGFKEWKKELQKTAGKKGFSSEKLDEAINTLFERSKGTFDKNLEKFKIYAMRNAFAPTTGGEGAESDVELHDLRSRCMQLHGEYRGLLDAGLAMDTLHKDMRSAMFNMKVGGQAFDDADNTVAETVAGLTQSRDKLLEMCRDANDVVSRIEQAQGHSTEEEDGSGAMEVQGSIATGDVDDILLLSRSIQQKK